MSQLPFVSEDCDDPRVRDVFDRMRKRWPGAPGLKSDIGMLAIAMNQAKPDGTNSPKGTRCTLL